MGVHGLWQLLSSTGKPVPLDSLEGKVLAVDVSVWLHQLSKGMRDSSGNPLPNAHLHGLFTRICKLLYYRIKPVFVFDGGVPALKKQTLASRRNKREEADRTSSLMQQKILTNLIRSQALKEAYGLDKLPDLPPPQKSTIKGGKDTIFQLPPLPESSTLYLSQKSAYEDTYIERQELQQMVEEEYEDIGRIDVESEDFQALPPEIQHEIIKDMRLRRKNYNLSKIVNLPDDSKDFSNYQLSKLVKHNKLNTRLEQVRKELNQKQTHSLTKHYGGNINATDDVYSQRMVSDDSSHYILVKRNLQKKRRKEEVDLTESESEVVGEVCRGQDEDDELLNDSDEDSGGDVDIMEESRLIFNELNEKHDERSDIKESELEHTSKNIVTLEKIGDSVRGCSEVDEKPRFTAVIEVDSDSGSESSEDGELIETPVVVEDEYDNDVIIIDDGQSDPELQFAIEQSLKEVCDANRSMKMDSIDSRKDMGAEMLPELETYFGESFHKCADNVESNNTSLPRSENDEVLFGKLDIPVVTAGRRTGYSYNGQNQNVFEKSGTHKTSELKRTFEYNRELTEKKSNATESGDKKEVKTGTVSANRLYKNEMEIDLTGEIGQRRIGSSIFKRKISCLSIESTNSSDGSSKVQRMDSSDAGYVIEDDSEDSSDSEGDFIEVKVDLTSVKVDDLFPASMFEVSPTEVNTEVSPTEVNTDVSQTEVNTEASLTEVSTEVSPTESNAEEKPIEVNMSEANTSEVVIAEVKAPKARTSEAKSSEVAMPDVKAPEDNTSEVTMSEGNATESKNQEIDTDDDDDVKNVTIEHGIMGKQEKEESSVPEVEDSDREQTAHKRATSPVVPSLVRQFESLNEQNIRDLRVNLASENKQLRQEKGRQKRLAISITDQMHSEAQELLQLFGIPFIVSPTEAEAQCAQLELINLTHGTITDDSDIWLFGGKCVFKNFFNQQRHVECFKDVNISSQLGLKREDLINIAMLCGSDYTEGIRGVGPVTAMEILASFPGPGLEGLVKFQAWWEQSHNEITVPAKESKFLSRLKELDIRPGFPSPHVVEAYLSPTVDDSSEKFSWSLPNLEELRQFACNKLKWNCEKTDEVLLPVMRRLSERQSQRSISAFFQPEVYMKPAAVKSKRLQKVVSKFINPGGEEEEEDKQNDVKRETKSKGQRGQGDSESPVKMLDLDSEPKNNNTKRKTRISDKEHSSQESTGTNIEQSIVKRRTNVKVAKTGTDIKSKNVGQRISDTLKGRGQEFARGHGSTRGQGSTRGRGSANVALRSKVGEHEVYFSDSGSSLDSESDSSTSDTDDEGVNDQMPVVERGLNIDEILNLKMGCKLDELKTSKRARQEGRVFENVINVNEILHLDSGVDYGSLEELNTETDQIAGKSSERKENNPMESVNEVNKMISEDYGNEGGFIRDDDSVMEIEHCSAESKTELSSIELHNFAEGSSECNPGDGDNGIDIGKKLKNSKKQLSEHVIQDEKSSVLIGTEITGSYEQETNDSCKQETKRTRSSRTNSRRSNSETPQSGFCVPETEIKQEPVIEMDNPVKSVVSESVHKSCDTEDDSLPESGRTVVTANTKAMRSTKTKAKSKESIYANNPIKPVVSGLPWTEKGKGRRKWLSGKGMVRGQKITPVETVLKKTKQTEPKRTFGTVNLSESDSD